MLKNMAKIALLSPLALGALPANATHANSWADFMNDPFFSFPKEFKCATQSGQRLVKTEKGYRLEVALPGFKKEDVTVSVDEQNYLIIKARRASSQEKKDTENVIYDSFNSSEEMMQSFKLGNDVDTESVQATMKEGVLTINVKTDPKKTTRKQIKIN